MLLKTMGSLRASVDRIRILPLPGALMILYCMRQESGVIRMEIGGESYLNVNRQVKRSSCRRGSCFL